MDRRTPVCAWIKLRICAKTEKVMKFHSHFVQNFHGNVGLNQTQKHKTPMPSLAVSDKGLQILVILSSEHQSIMLFLFQYNKEMGSTKANFSFVMPLNHTWNTDRARS